MDNLKRNKIHAAPKPSFIVYIKIIFLTVIIIFGVFILNNLAKNQKQDQTKSGEFGITNLFSGKNIKEALDKEVRTNEAYKSATSELNKTTSEVLGEATRIKDHALEQGKEFMTDYVYKQTVGTMIESLINQLPEQQKEKVLQNICK